MTLPFIATLTLLAIAASACGRTEPAVERLPYPVAAKGDVVDDYSGTKVADPYRWMEDLDSKEVADWVAAQNAVTEPISRQLPLRASLQRSGSPSSGTIRASAFRCAKAALFYTKNSGLQRQAPLFVRSSLDAPPALVIDPNVISPDGSLSLAQWTPSPDGKLLAYGLSEGGADWRDDPRARHRHRQGPRRRGEVDAVLRHLVDQGLQGLLLLALSRAAAGQGARGRAVGPGALLPPRRHAAVGGLA